MKKVLRFLSVGLLAQCLITGAHAQMLAQEQVAQPSGMKVNVELLSDTHGANLDAYMKGIISELRKSWLPLVAGAEKQTPQKQGETTVSFTITPDGRTVAMQLDGTAHDVSLDKAAWSVVKGMQYSSLPVGMEGQSLKVRVHFVVN
jgi:TonB family protein